MGCLSSVHVCAGLADESSDSSDEDDNDDDDDDDNSQEEGEEVCPPNCEVQLYDKVWEPISTGFLHLLPYTAKVPTVVPLVPMR